MIISRLELRDRLHSLLSMMTQQFQVSGDVETAEEVVAEEVVESVETVESGETTSEK